jgi:hypothetical protein
MMSVLVPRLRAQKRAGGDDGFAGVGALKALHRFAYVIHIA